MKTLFLPALLSSCLIVSAAESTNSTPAGQNRATRFPRPDVRYPYSPDSSPQPGVPKGKITDFVWKDSQAFPGTIRRCAVYVPAQYDASKPAALMVLQDGVRHYLYETNEFKVPTVLDNLIHKKELPVIIAVFIDPGYKADAFPTDPKVRPDNRSFEYDTLSPAYSEFVINEIIPHLKKQYNITDNPEGRAIGGMSSGGICAWTVAWERPDQFRKVLSHVGSFTNIKGGNKYPDLIRSAEPKPIRVFLQDGANDNRGRQPDRNWVIANHNLAAALEEKDYDYKYVYGEGAHNGNHGGSILPDTLRWLWRDYPK